MVPADTCPNLARVSLLWMLCECSKHTSILFDPARLNQNGYNINSTPTSSQMTDLQSTIHDLVETKRRWCVLEQLPLYVQQHESTSAVELRYFCTSCVLFSHLTQTIRRNRGCHRQVRQDLNNRIQVSQSVQLRNNYIPRLRYQVQPPQLVFNAQHVQWVVHITGIGIPAGFVWVFPRHGTGSVRIWTHGKTRTRLRVRVLPLVHSNSESQRLLCFCIISVLIRFTTTTTSNLKVSSKLINIFTN